jgi:hypothetical protein
MNQDAAEPTVTPDTIIEYCRLLRDIKGQPAFCPFLDIIILRNFRQI